MTPSAARACFEAILRKPTIRRHIRQDQLPAFGLEKKEIPFVIEMPKAGLSIWRIPARLKARKKSANDFWCRKA